jgi:hypothetical protein
MRLLLFSGLLYLLGVSIILILRPEWMFAKNGKWKEFGLGRNKEHYTWMPFWLFAIIWAILSYLIVISLTSTFSSVSVADASYEKEISINAEEIEPTNISKKSSIIQSTLSNKSVRKNAKLDMKPGYYILDTQETIKTGIPKYIFLGPEAPNLIYNTTTDMDVNTMSD